MFLSFFVFGLVSILFFLGRYEDYCIDFAENMKKGNSVTRKVQRRRRRGGNIHKANYYPIKSLTRKQQTGTQRPRPPSPRPSQPDLQVNGPGNVNDTLSLLNSLYGPPRRNT